MRNHSDALAAAVSGSHTAVTVVNVVRDGKVVRQLDAHGGRVISDATAAQRTTIEVDVSDPDGDLTPEDMESLLSPFGTRIEVERGARLQGESFQIQTKGSIYGWSTSGVMTLKDDGSGGLVLGP
jgi:hypothetical protein